MRSNPGWWLALAVLMLGGCASTPQAMSARDAEAKRFVSEPGYAAIYVFRPDFPAETMEDTVLHVDDRLIGQTLPGTFFRVDVKPGAQVVRASAAGSTQITVDTRPGEIYFVQLNVMSSANSRLLLVEPARGQATIRKCCALLENWAPGQRPLLR